MTKYRRAVLTGELGNRVRKLIREICGTHEVSIMNLKTAFDN
ncbi:MAG: transposase [Candidatus Omnitrophota bacterium]